MKKKFPQVYLDISIGAHPAGRVVFELFSDLTPKTCENFRGLCTGEYGSTGLGARTKRLHYLNSAFHRIIDGFVIQGGDITNGDGTGGASIYGPTFPDENFQRRHACAGLLSMANRGRNTNSSQFFITLKQCPHLDGKHTVFGQVIDGMEVVRKIAKVSVDVHDKPRIPVIINDCGEVDDPRNFLRYDPFQKVIFDEIEKEKKKMFEGKKVEDEKVEADKEKDSTDITKKRNLDELNSDVVEGDSILPVSKSLNNKHRDKLLELRQKINEAKKQNATAVLEEEKMATDPNYEKNKRKEVLKSRTQQYEEDLEAKSIAKDKFYLNQTAVKSEFQEENKKKKNETFGWDVFNEDSLFRAYKKRCTDLTFYKDVYEKQKNGVAEEESKPSEEMLKRLTDDIEKQIKKRQSFSRRRAYYAEEQDITSINERNRIYNEKLQRSFKPYAVQIKANLEKQTAD